MSDKLITIQEFDIITCNKDYKDNNQYKYIDKKYFDEFERFIREVTAEENTADTLDFFKVYRKKGVGDVIKAKNYVGLVQLKSGYQIQIFPKIDFFNKNEETPSTEKVFIKMLCSLKEFPGKIFNFANLKVDNMNLYEVFINMYICQVQVLAKRGLRSAYTQVEDNLNFFKGKLLVNKHILKNVAHKEKFYTAYDEFNTNRAENRLIKAALVKLHRLSSNQENKKTIKQLMPYFELVEASVNYEQDFSKVVINKNTNEYKDIMAWSKVFLLNKSFTAFMGDTAAKALLFPMEKVYEAYVAQYVKRVFSEKGYDVAIQDREHYLFKEGGRNVFSLRPDIVIRGNGKTIIMDTKWKRLTDNKNKNYGISQADMYQMFAYSKKYKTPYIWVLYPKIKDMNVSQDIKFESDNTVVSLFFVDVADIGASINRLKEKVRNL